MFNAILAAMLYGISTPFSKLLLTRVPPAMLAALLYLGAGTGILLLKLAQKRSKEAPLAKSEFPYIFGMVVLDIAAPIFMMLGLTAASPSGAALLSNFEIVATTLIALFLFGEAVSRRLWLSIAIITLSSILLSVEDLSNLTLNTGALFVLLACVCWGFENNCTRMLSLKDPMETVIIKGFGSGAGSLLIAWACGEHLPAPLPLSGALLLGFAAYGLSIFFYISAQRSLGASRTSAYYAFAPFVGSALSFILFRETLTLRFALALALMILGTYLAAVEKHTHLHRHERIEHNHRHNHSDGHHTHTHPYPVQGEHSHPHIHSEMTHTHPHTPDIHHHHSH